MMGMEGRKEDEAMAGEPGGQRRGAGRYEPGKG
jgi:hypothetical protein